MANLTELAEWTAGIYQLETDDPVEGGPNGIDNLQAKQLANRTAYLKALAEALGAGKQPLDATLTALAGLVTAADKLIYATGADAFALASFTAYARTLLAAADAASARGVLSVPSVAEMNAAIAALVASSPAALDTLNELAAALGNDANFATTVTNALAGKQPLDATLTALAGMVTAADKLIYASGPDAFALTDLTSFARTLLAAVDANSARTVLGISDSVKSGTVIYFAANAAPSGYLAANGAAVSRTTYAALFAAIGTAFGAGDGATTFNLPDGRGEFIRGWDNGRGIDSGRVFGSAQAQDVQPHTHSIGTDVRGAGIGGLVCLANNGGAYLTGSTGTSETRPRNIALLACIKY